LAARGSGVTPLELWCGGWASRSSARGGATRRGGGESALSFWPPRAARAGGGVMFAFRFGPAVPAWQVTNAAGQSSLFVGGWLETGEGQRAAFNVADIGPACVGPRPRLRLLHTGPGEHRLELLHGTLHATIWAPPNQFFVETPSTLAVD